jgi:GAF domain-containing protein
MFTMNPYSLGILFVITGLILWLLARLLIKAVPRFAAVSPLTADDKNPSAVHGEAVLVVQPGGRVVTINEPFRQLFQLQPGEIPNLEWVARRIRPSETFLQLCSSDGKERLIIEGRFCQVTSYHLSLSPGGLVMMILRPSSGDDATGESSPGLNLQRLQTITELNKAVASSLDMGTTIQSIIESVERLLPADYLEVCVWDASLGILVPYRFLGIPGAERALERMEHHYRLGEGFAGKLAQAREPVWISNIEIAGSGSQAIDPSQMSLRSYLGVPLLVGNEFVGTLEVGSITPDSLQSEDLDLLNMFAEQAAVALHNAVLFRNEQRRAVELSGLAQLAQAFSSVREPRSLFARLVQSIVPLIDSEIVGFLLFNETQRRLESQVPYFGIPAQFLELYNLPVPPGSRAEETLLNHTLMVSDNAAEDPEWQETGFAPLAHGASLRETALVPLTSGGRMLGYLQVSNHVGGSRPFSQDELHLLTIIANQAAPMIENATLVQQMRARALRAEALRKIGSLASSAANLEEILHFSLQALTRLLKADVGAAFLLGPNSTILRLHQPSCYGNSCELPEAKSTLSVDDPQFPFTVTAGQHPVTFGSVSYDQPIIPFYQEILRLWNVQSTVIVPLIVRDVGIGELWIGSATQGYFDLGDMQMVSTAAGQLAGVVEQSYLSSQTDESLRRRVEQLTALMHITRELSTSLDLNSLLQLVYDQALVATRAECGTILLLDWNLKGETRLISGFSVGDQSKRALSTLENHVLEMGEALYIPEFYQTDFELPHAGVGSALVVPVIYQQKSLGLIELHSAAPNHFDSDAIDITRSLASQAAVALANAIQYEQQRRRGELLKRELETLGKLFQVLQDLRHNLPLAEALQVVAESIRQTIQFQSVLISVYEPQDEHLYRITQAGISTADWEELQRHHQPWSGIQTLLEDQFKVGMAYYIPFDKQPVIPEEIHTLNLLPESQLTEEDSWDANDFLLVPLYDAEGTPLGLISLDAPLDGRSPDLATFEALDLFGMQVSLVIENSRNIRQLQERVDGMELSASQMSDDIQIAHELVPRLKQKDQEQSAAIQRLDRQVRQLRAGLEIAVLSSRTSSVNALLRTMAEEMLARFDLQVALIAEQTPAGPHLVEVIGDLPENARPEALFGQRNPLRQMLEDGGLILIADVSKDPEWHDNPLLNALSAKSLIGLPLVTGHDSKAGVLVIGRVPVSDFIEEDYQVFSQVSSQLEVALQNLQLLSDTRRRLQELDLLLVFSRKLGGLPPEGILQTLVEDVVQAIPAAQAAWAAIWNENDNQLKLQAIAGYRNPDSLLAVHFENADSGPMPLPLQVLQNGNLLQVDEIQFAKRLPPLVSGINGLQERNRWGAAGLRFTCANRARRYHSGCACTREFQYGCRVQCGR